MSYVIEEHRKRVGLRIRKARRSKGFSHDALAAQCGTSRQHLIKLEKGQHLAGDVLLARIAEATDRTVAFLEGEGDDDEESELPRRDLLEALYGALEFALKKTEPTANPAKATAGSNHHGG